MRAGVRAIWRVKYRAGLAAAVACRLAVVVIDLDEAACKPVVVQFRMATDDWDTVMNVHLCGSFLMGRATQKCMTAAGFGRIVNLSSTSAPGNRGQVDYGAAKVGLQGFTKTLALELGKQVWMRLT